MGSVFIAVVTKVVKHPAQYECLHLRLYIFLVGKSSRQDAHSDSLKIVVSALLLLAGGEILTTS